MKNIVITGGSAGLGRALTREFCKHKHNVLITGRDIGRLRRVRDEIHRTTLGTCHIHACDVTKYADVAGLSAHVETVFEGARVDHWINNAGMCEGPRELGEVSFEEIDHVVNTNVLGVVYCSKVASKMGARNIYMVSGHGSDGRKTPGFAVYGATKAAVSQFAATLADELRGGKGEGGEKGVGVHVLAPGIMKTELSRKLLEDDTMPPLNKWVFSVMAAEPEVVAERLVPKILGVKGTGKTLWGFV